MITQNCGGKIPKPGTLQPQDNALAKQAQEAIAEVLEQYNNLGFSKALEEIWSVIGATDKYLTTEQPWALTDSEADQQRRATILWTTAEVLRVVTALTHPVLPESTAKVWTLLGQSEPLGHVSLESLRFGDLKPGTTLGKSQTLFPRIDKAEAIERMEIMEKEEQQKPHPSAAATPAAAPAASPAATGAASAAGVAAAPEGVQRIGIEDFAKVEMRVGQVKTAERIVGADKLLKLTVDIGTEVRQICAGIAQYYEPESLIGRKVVVVVNLAPRKLRGVESNGMIVAASVGPEGRPVLAGFAEEVEVGARLK
jgi:methionyl-tRNA synthetase